MSWLDTTLEKLASNPVCGYRPGGAPASEPTALAVMALAAAHAKSAERAEPGRAFLAKLQSGDGSVGIREREVSPGWPTSLAVLAWLTASSTVNQVPAANPYQTNLDKATDWILSAKGTTIARSPEMGHDPTIVAWSWAENTHSWVEPTALHVLGLKAVGKSTHHRTRDGVAMLIDRQLASGGWNYGNTTILGQTLRSHVQPSGVALLAVADEKDASGRIAKSIAYVKEALRPDTTPASLAWGLLGLAAHGETIPQAEKWLEKSYQWTLAHDQSPAKQALLALAAIPDGWKKLARTIGTPS